jgi:tetratricopeptide (TPR) repeat protein
LERNQIQKIQLFYFGAADPKYYGLDDFYSTENLNSFVNEANIHLPEYLAISANFRYGGSLFLPNDLTELIASYGFGQPLTSIGHSILVYKLSLSDSRIYENAGILAERKGAVNMAAALLRKALQINPASARAHLNLGNLFARDGRFEMAIQHYTEAIKINPNVAESYHNLGRIMVAQQRIDRAIHHFQQALRVKPEYAEAHHSLGQALARQGRVDEAAYHYQQALRILKESRDGGNRDRQGFFGLRTFREPADKQEERR